MAAKRIVIAGGSGFIGRALVRRLVGRGDRVTVLSRRPGEAKKSLPEGVRVAGYTPNEAGPWFDEVAQTDALVNLAGEPLVGVRWSDAKKKEFEASRIGGNAMLVKAIEKTAEKDRPKVVVGASGVGFYGPRSPDEEVDESTPAGRDYVALLAERWEHALLPAAELGARVVHARFGVALGKGGGALEKMARPFRMHVGGPLGSGHQILPWIHLVDLVGILLLVIDREEARGPVNLTSPNPVPMAEFARAIGIVLHRASYMRVPETAVRALFGEGAEPLLTGQRVLPKVALELGYEFEYPDVIPALESLLAKS